MITVEQIIYIIPVLGLTASILYYGLVLRNQNKTRRAQLYMQIFQRLSSVDFRMTASEINHYEYKDFEDCARADKTGSAGFVPTPLP